MKPSKNKYLNQEITLKLTIGEARSILRYVQDYADYFLQPSNYEYLDIQDTLDKIYKELIKYE